MNPDNAHAHMQSESLGLWEPKRTLTLEAARRHSARIKLLQKLLLGFSALLVLILAVNFATQPETTPLPDKTTESVRMTNPRYSGRTEDGLPFYLTAATAVRTQLNQNELTLEKPVLEFLREEGVKNSFVVAETGTYDDVRKILNLYKAVNLKTDDGYICDTSHARIFARDKRIEGDERIECVGNFGIANGNAYEINDNYSVFVFKNGMDAIIDQSEADGIDTPVEGGQ